MPRNLRKLSESTSKIWNNSETQARRTTIEEFGITNLFQKLHAVLAACLSLLSISETILYVINVEAISVLRTSRA